MENNELKDLLLQFKNYTINLIYDVGKDNFDSLESLFNKRQEILDSISKSEHTVEDFVLIYDELELKLYQDKLEQLITSKHSFIKEKLKSISKTIKVNSEYNKRIYAGTRIFSKKI
jgi:hypothetical protein